MTKRKKNQQAETEVLVRSARRCCVCYGLNRDENEKNGQIAHLDHNSSNSVLDNLVYLCFDHHDQYDSQTSQSKGLTLHEVKHYRDELYEAVSLMREKELHDEDSPFSKIGNDIQVSGYSLPLPHLSTLDRLAMQSIFASDDFAGANLDMLSENIDAPKDQIQYCLDKLTKLGLIYETGSSEHGVFYNLDRFISEAIVADQYCGDEIPITRLLRINCISGYHPDEVPRIILEGKGLQKISIRLRDADLLIDHLTEAINQLKRLESNRLKT